MARKKKITIIAKPTHDCNLRCKYCYIEDGAESGKMSDATLQTSIAKVSDFSDSSNWIWHGGEPLLMGLDFFKKVQRLQKKKSENHRFTNGIQTNGTLITEALLDFIEEFSDFYLGISLDGPEHLHNKSRLYASQKGSFEQVMCGIQKAKKGGKRISGGVICVVNATNIDHPKELYEFFRDHEINVKFNPLIKSGNARKNINSLGITPSQYGNFLKKLWEIYNTDVESKGDITIEIDPFIDVLGNVATKVPLGCNYSGRCRDSFISIGPQGDIYPCGRFDGIPEFWMGNIWTHTIEEAINSEIHQKLKRRSIETIAGCEKCDEKEICNSGCMHNAYCEGDIMGKDPYCKSYKTLFTQMTRVLVNEGVIKNG